MTDILLDILHELSYYHTPTDRLLEKYVTERLDKSINTYRKELTLSIGYLERADSLKVLKTVNRTL